jgi:LPXTG-site transpeptidase (sortase) family protein
MKVAPIGQPTSTPVASNAQPAKTPAAQYTVPADHPKQLTVDKLGINANIVSLGTLKDGSLDAPKTAWDVGWYDNSTLPGSGYGALLIDGHVNDALNSPGVFYKLNTLAVGDTMQITRGDGQVFTYNVNEVDQTPIAQVDMSKMLRSITPGKEGLNLITCGGVYNYTLHTYTDRILVYATLV